MAPREPVTRTSIALLALAVLCGNCGCRRKCTILLTARGRVRADPVGACPCVRVLCSAAGRWLPSTEARAGACPAGALALADSGGRSPFRDPATQRPALEPGAVAHEGGGRR
jgi:hypothetical protein